MNSYAIIISEKAKNQLVNIYDFIKENNPTNAKKVRLKILNLISTLNFMPQKYPKETYLDQNIGEFRFIPIYSYKIIFEVKETDVVVLQIFHTSRHPSRIQNLD